jgi:hypothetical protein
MGRRAQAEAALERVTTTTDYVSPAELAVLYVGLGDWEAAFWRAGRRVRGATFASFRIGRTPIGLSKYRESEWLKEHREKIPSLEIGT